MMNGKAEDEEAVGWPVNVPYTLGIPYIHVGHRLKAVGKSGSAFWNALPCFLFRPIAYDLHGCRKCRACRELRPASLEPRALLV